MPKPNELRVSRTDQLKNITNCSLNEREIAQHAEVSLKTVETYAKGLEIDAKSRKAIENVIRKSPKIKELNDIFLEIGDNSQALKNRIILEIFRSIGIAGEDFKKALVEAQCDPSQVNNFLRSVSSLLPKDAHITGEIGLREIIQETVVDCASAEVQDVQEDEETAEITRSIEIK